MRHHSIVHLLLALINYKVKQNCKYKIVRFKCLMQMKWHITVLDIQYFHRWSIGFSHFMCKFSDSANAVTYMTQTSSIQLSFLNFLLILQSHSNLKSTKPYFNPLTTAPIPQNTVKFIINFYLLNLWDFF